MATFPVVRGVRLRASKVNSCGLPIAGPANRIVTSGFVTAKITAVLNAAKELEQENADGMVCVLDRTPPQRKYYTVAIELCNVQTELISLFNGWQQVLDYNDMPIGFQDQEDVLDDYGVALEIWTGGRSDDDCPTPTVDSIFSAPSDGLKYGYLLIGATEFTLADISVGAAVSTFTLSGISISMPQWGRGPYNVAGIDSSGTPGRLLTPLNDDSHFTLFRTPVAPPAETVGAAPLAINTLFTSPNFYFGGPSNAPAAAVAPAQGSSETGTVTITGIPTGGTWTLLVDGLPTAAIAYNASAAAVLAAIVALVGSENASFYSTTGGALPGSPVVISSTVDTTLAAGTNSLTGGTSPTVTVTAPGQSVVTETLTIGGTPTGGTFTLLIDGVATAPIAFGATAAAVLAAIVTLVGTENAAFYNTSGGALPGSSVVITATVDVEITAGTNSLTGGTSPTVTVSP